MLRFLADEVEAIDDVDGSISDWLSILSCWDKPDTMNTFLVGLNENWMEDIH